MTIRNAAALDGISPRSNKKSGNPVAAAAAKHTVCRFVMPRTNLVRTAAKSFETDTNAIYSPLSIGRRGFGRGVFRQPVDTSLCELSEHVSRHEHQYCHFIKTHLCVYKRCFVYHSKSPYAALNIDFARLPDFIMAKQSKTVYAVTEKIAMWMFVDTIMLLTSTAYIPTHNMRKKP